MNPMNHKINGCHLGERLKKLPSDPFPDVFSVALKGEEEYGRIVSD